MFCCSFIPIGSNILICNNMISDILWICCSVTICFIHAGDVLINVTMPPPQDRNVMPGYTILPSTQYPPPVSAALTMSPAVIAVIVLAILCVIAGAIYACIYYTRINPKGFRGQRKYGTGKSGAQDDDLSAGTHTHLFFFRKSWEEIEKDWESCQWSVE